MAVRKAIRILWWILHVQIQLQLTTALPTSTPSQPDLMTYDVAIIGGGPAGLAAAMSLGRVARSALLFDSGDYRNGPTREMHDIPTLDGTPPAVFRALAREQIAHYPSVTLTNGTITAIVAQPPDPNANATASSPPLFLLSAENGTMYTSRRIILATGMRDLLPSTPGLATWWGKGIYWCPWCDGWEHRNRPFGQLGPFSAAAINSSLAQAQTLNPMSVMLTNGTATQAAKDKLATAGTAPPTAGGLPDWERRLASYNITVDDRIIARISRMNATTTAASGDDGAAADESTEGDFVVEFDGATTEEDAVIVNSMKGTFPAALKGLDWIRALGVNLTDGAGGTDVKVQVDRQMQTTVPGVFAVGDMNSDGSGNVVHALYSAKKAVVVLHGDLGQQYADAKVASSKPSKRDLIPRHDEDDELDFLIDAAAILTPRSKPSSSSSSSSSLSLSSLASSSASSGAALWRALLSTVGRSADSRTLDASSRLDVLRGLEEEERLILVKMGMGMGMELKR